MFVCCSIWRASVIRHVTALKYLISKYESAKREKSEGFLRKLRNVHRRARLCLDKPGVKGAISDFIGRRKETLRRRMYFDAVRPIFDYIERYGQSDRPGKDFARILPSLMSTETINNVAHIDDSSQGSESR